MWKYTNILKALTLTFYRQSVVTKKAMVVKYLVRHLYSVVNAACASSHIISSVFIRTGELI